MKNKKSQVVYISRFLLYQTMWCKETSCEINHFTQVLIGIKSPIKNNGYVK